MTANTEKIGNVTLIYDDYIGKDLYVDGAEEALLELVKTHEPSEYNRLIKEAGNWQTLYHLSHIRGNIAEFLPITKHDKVLEIGAGCGAITGTLAKKAASVDCIELSKARSLVNANRNREYDNITIRVGNFQDTEARLTEKYDYITLIGVFEYAKSYIQDENPFDTFLSMIKKHLAPNGKIVIAIENKFGLKYFAGCREDHAGLYFTGLEGYINTDFVETFSKDELTAIANRNGLTELTFYYPYPDYKLPQVIYCDKHLPECGDLTESLYNFDGERLVTFNESNVYDEIIKDGKFPFFSNSFLMLAGIEGGNSTAENGTVERNGEDERLVYAKYSNERAESFQIRTDIIKNREGKAVVRKTAFSEKATEHIAHNETCARLLQESFENTKFEACPCKRVDEKTLEFAFLSGEQMDHVLDEALDQKGEDAFFALLKEYKEQMLSLAKEDFQNSEDFQRVFGERDFPAGTKALAVANIDQIFQNIKISEDTWSVYDYEWTFCFPVPVSYVFYRCALFYAGFDRKSLLDSRGIDLFEFFGIREDEKKQFAAMEDSLQRYIAGGYTRLREVYDIIAPDVFRAVSMIQEMKKQRNIRQVTVRKTMADGTVKEDLWDVAEKESDVTVLDIPVSAQVDTVNVELGLSTCIIDFIRVSLLRSNGEVIIDNKLFLCNGTLTEEEVYLFTEGNAQVYFNELQDDAVLHIEYQAEYAPKEFIEMTQKQLNSCKRERQDRIDALNLEIAKLKIDMENLNSEKERLQADYDTVVNSKAWKSTKTLRAMADKMKGKSE